MSEQNLFLARRVGAKLRKVEDALDDALQLAASFAAELPEARKQARLSAVHGQGAFDAAARAVQALTESRNHIVALHNQLDVVRAQMGLKTLAFGGGAPKPPLPSVDDVAQARTSIAA